MSAPPSKISGSAAVFSFNMDDVQVTGRNRVLDGFGQVVVEHVEGQGLVPDRGHPAVHIMFGKYNLHESDKWRSNMGCVNVLDHGKEIVHR
jgi:hypothetical protein